LFDLEVKRSDLSQRFTESYPPLVQVEQQLALTENALKDAREVRVTSETTDQNPTHQLLRDELAKAITDREALRGKGEALFRAVGGYQASAERLNEQRAQQERLVQAVKQAQEDYQLYQRKQEEARISDVLDSTRVANVSIVEAPTTPPVPVRSGRLVILLLGLAAALIASVTTVVILDHLHPYFRSPDEVEAFLGVPVLASMPGSIK
jgi:uncharacterized protein involved in exopolysaccharide biosynthesis